LQAHAGVLQIKARSVTRNFVPRIPLAVASCLIIGMAGTSPAMTADESRATFSQRRARNVKPAGIVITLTGRSARC
jgi:hypothetical protein